MMRASCDGERYSVDLTARDSEIVVTLSEAIAEIEEVEPGSLPPLERTVSGEHLEALACSSDPVRITFEYHSYRVTVRGEDELQLEPLD